MHWIYIVIYPLDNINVNEVMGTYKVQKYGATLVVGEDIRVDQIRFFLDNTLVRKFMVHRVAMGHLNDQLQVKWVSLLDYGPIFHMLAKGWI